MTKRILALMLAVILGIMPLAALADNFVPSRAVAYMDSHFTCGCSRGGTGTMIGRYGLITAAHNLYCHQHGKPLKYCNFYFGAKSANSCWYEYSGKFQYTVYETFQNGYDSQNDIGYVIFDYPVGKETGWFACIAGDDYTVDLESNHIYSYDGKRHLQSLSSVQHLYDSTQVYWNGYLSGSEGGPVYIWDEGADFPCLMAVYTSHDSDGNGYGRRLTQNVFNDMKADGAFN